jgi:hypothetical protein
MPDATRDEWVRRVLGVDTGGPSVGGGTASRRSGIDYTKLLLRWRAAQAQAADNLGKLAAGVLALKEVREDPRLDQVQQAVKTLPILVPNFGEELADNLNALMNGGPAADSHRQAALSTLVRYRALLNGHPVLRGLEDFAKRRLGADLATVTALSEVIGELEASLTRPT